MRKIFITLCCILIQQVYSFKIIAQTCQFQTISPVGDYNYCNSDPWALIFSDEFDGSTLDLNKWSAVTGVGRDFDYNDQKAWHKPENVVVSNGTLKLISKNETLLNMPVITNWNPYTVRYDDFNYSTAEIFTNNNFSYGKYEARIKVPSGYGLWPAFWLYGGDPTWNEIDIFEFYGNYPNEISMTSHYNGNMCPDSENFDQSNSAFHVFTLIYEKYKIEWYVDGELKRRMYRYYGINGQEVGCAIYANNAYIMNKSFPINPMAIRLNTAIQSGSKAPNNIPFPFQPVTFPVKMEIDWVRYYEHKSCGDVLINSPSQIVYTNSYTALVGNKITVNSSTPIQIQSNNQYQMLAANKIVLKPGFSVMTGADYNAKIDPLLCTNTYRIAAENSDETAEYIQNDNIPPTSSDKILIYPNPSNNTFSLSMNFIEEKNTSFKIYNSSGKQVYISSLGELKNAEQFVDINLESGLYMIKILHGEKEFSEKLIITK